VQPDFPVEETHPVPSRNRLFPTIALVLLTTLGVRGGSAAEDQLTVNHAWIQEGPPGLEVLAGFVDLENRSARDITVAAIETPVAERVEIHLTEIKDNMATMSHLHELTVKAGARIAFSHGGHHLMLFGVREPLHAGDKIELHVRTTDGAVIKATAEVRKDEAQ
jgi:copper(I)-binding protein